MKKSVCSFVLMLLCIVLVSVVALFGVSELGLPGVFDENAINKGLDLAGGSSVTYVAEPDEETEDFNMAEAMATVETMLRQRLDTLGYTEATIAKMGDDKIRVEIPGVDDPEKALQMLGSTAKLEFMNSAGEVFMDGKEVKSATAAYGPVNDSVKNEYFVSLEFTSEGGKKFADATEAAAKLASTEQNYISIIMDGDTVNPVSVASVRERIDGGNCIISGGDNFDEEYAKYLAEIISAGKLPVELREIELRYVGPSLGAQALDSSVFAAAIGILLVMIFMILVYRVPGIVSALSLAAYTAIFLIIIVGFKVNLSLPGIAGVILTIGMAVDSNVVIYERIKEELNAGKSTKAAVKAGFDRAFTAIFDSNITTIIAAAVLWYFGSGAIRGFAITLFAGVVISLFTALFVTRVLLYAVTDMGAGRWMLGAKNDKKSV